MSIPFLPQKSKPHPFTDLDYYDSVMQQWDFWTHHPMVISGRIPNPLLFPFPYPPPYQYDLPYLPQVYSQPVKQEYCVKKQENQPKVGSTSISQKQEFKQKEPYKAPKSQKIKEKAVFQQQKTKADIYTRTRAKNKRRKSALSSINKHKHQIEKDEELDEKSNKDSNFDINLENPQKIHRRHPQFGLDYEHLLRYDREKSKRIKKALFDKKIKTKQNAYPTNEAICQQWDSEKGIFSQEFQKGLLQRILPHNQKYL